jgi:hypothetical protein
VIWEVPERVIALPLDEMDRALQAIVDGNFAAENTDQKQSIAVSAP